MRAHADGLAACSAVRAGETVLSVPRALWLTPATAAASPLGPHLEGQPPWVQLALCLLRERCAPIAGAEACAATLTSGDSADPASRWAPYIALLPEQPDAPLFWCVLACSLCCKRLRVLVRGQR